MHAPAFVGPLKSEDFVLDILTDVHAIPKKRDELKALILEAPSGGIP